eukprot:TRINITY_DN2360_c0_g1_i2.p1 TRINITY_DN2360_c0_g1~~TRINITY_DN2360_c0_g1_i2.p1  ORF type:complete len:418 (+),score=144.45 TRINITY_DN2360_c0_g1_i2:173-1426(+)
MNSACGHCQDFKTELKNTQQLYNDLLLKKFYRPERPDFADDSMKRDETLADLRRQLNDARHQLAAQAADADAQQRLLAAELLAAQACRDEERAAAVQTTRQQLHDAVQAGEARLRAERSVCQQQLADERDRLRADLELQAAEAARQQQQQQQQQQQHAADCCRLRQIIADQAQSQSSALGIYEAEKGRLSSLLEDQSNKVARLEHDLDQSQSVLHTLQASNADLKAALESVDRLKQQLESQLASAQRLGIERSSDLNAARLALSSLEHDNVQLQLESKRVVSEHEQAMAALRQAMASVSGEWQQALANWHAEQAAVALLSQQCVDHKQQIQVLTATCDALRGEIDDKRTAAKHAAERTLRLQDEHSAQIREIAALQASLARQVQARTWLLLLLLQCTHALSRHDRPACPSSCSPSTS